MPGSPELLTLQAQVTSLEQTIKLKNDQLESKKEQIEVALKRS